MISGLSFWLHCLCCYATLMSLRMYEKAHQTISHIVNHCTPTDMNPLTWGHPNFHTVEEGKLYRSKTLSGPELQEVIAKHNIKMILNLREEDLNARWYREEASIAERNNIPLLTFTLSSSKMPTQEQLQTLHDIAKQTPSPILVHCQAGADRTGLFSAFWKLAIQKKSLNEALQEQTLKKCHMALLFPAMRRTTKKVQTLIEKYGCVSSALDAYNSDGQEE